MTVASFFIFIMYNEETLKIVKINDVKRGGGVELENLLYSEVQIQKSNLDLYVKLKLPIYGRYSISYGKYIFLLEQKTSLQKFKLKQLDLCPPADHLHF